MKDLLKDKFNIDLVHTNNDISEVFELKTARAAKLRNDGMNNCFRQLAVKLVNNDEDGSRSLRVLYSYGEFLYAYCAYGTNIKELLFLLMTGYEKFREASPQHSFDNVFGLVEDGSDLNFDTTEEFMPLDFKEIMHADDSLSDLYLQFKLNKERANKLVKLGTERLEEAIKNSKLLLTEGYAAFIEVADNIQELYYLASYYSAVLYELKDDDNGNENN